MRFSQNSSPMTMATDPRSGLLVAFWMSWSPKILTMPSSTPPTSADWRTTDHGRVTPDRTRSMRTSTPDVDGEPHEDPDDGDDDRVAPQADPLRQPVGRGADDAGEHGRDEERRPERDEDAEVAQLVGEQVAGRALGTEAGPDPVAERPDPPDARQHQADQGDQASDGQQRELRLLEGDQPRRVLRGLDEPGQRLVERLPDAVEQVGPAAQDEPEDDGGDGEGGEDREEGVVGDPRGQQVAADLVVALVGAVGLEALDRSQSCFTGRPLPRSSPSGNSRTGTQVPPSSLT